MIDKVSKKQILSVAFVCYLGFTVSLFGMPTTDIQTAAINVWNEIIKAVDPNKVLKGSKSPKDFVIK